MKAEGGLKENVFIFQRRYSYQVFFLSFFFFYTFLLIDFHIVFVSLGIEFSLPLVKERKRSNELESQEDEGVEEKEKTEEWVSSSSVTVLHGIK